MGRGKIITQQKFYCLCFSGNTHYILPQEGLISWRSPMMMRWELWLKHKCMIQSERRAAASSPHLPSEQTPTQKKYIKLISVQAHICTLLHIKLQTQFKPLQFFMFKGFCMLNIFNQYNAPCWSVRSTWVLGKIIVLRETITAEIFFKWPIGLKPLSPMQGIFNV